MISRLVGLHVWMGGDWYGEIVDVYADAVLVDTGKKFSSVFRGALYGGRGFALSRSRKTPAQDEGSVVYYFNDGGVCSVDDCE
jgi:hypothetical protein